jgi:putative inorganic carbon (HCO3(-)) transporter
MNPLLRLNRLTEGFLAIICGFLLGGVALYINASSASNKIIAVILGALLAGIIVFLVGNLRYLLFGIIFIDLATGIDFFVTCDETFFLSTCGFNISLTTLALVGLYALWVISFRRDRRKQMVDSVRHPRLSFIGKMALGFIIAGLLSLLAARNISYALYQLWIYVTLLALFFYLANNITSQKELIYLVSLLVLGLIIQNVVMEMIAVGVLNNDMVSGALQRVAGTFRSPNVAGGYLAEVFCILLACLALKIPQWQKLVLGAVLVLAAYNLIGTESRGSWVVAAIGIVVIGVVGVAKKWIGARSLAFALIAVTVFAIFFSGTIINRWTADDNGSADARGPLAQIAFNMIRANPVVGVGSNNFGVVLFDYVEMDQFSAWLHIVHNDWLLVWSETGTIGVIFYVGFWLASIIQAIRLVRSPHPVYAVVATGILASMLGTSVFMMIERSSWRNLLELAWVEAALLTAMVRLQKQEAKPGAEKPPGQLTLLNFFH